MNDEKAWENCSVAKSMLRYYEKKRGRSSSPEGKGGNQTVISVLHLLWILPAAAAIGYAACTLVRMAKEDSEK